jgi:hypothetical protein
MENESILELTEENLIKYDFNSDVIERFLTWDNYEQTTQNNLGTFFASNIENKIYTGIEAHRKIYFRDKENPRFPFNDLDLVEAYYNLKEFNYLKEIKVVSIKAKNRMSKWNFHVYCYLKVVRL